MRPPRLSTLVFVGSEIAEMIIYRGKPADNYDCQRRARRLSDYRNDCSRGMRMITTGRASSDCIIVMIAITLFTSYLIKNVF